MVRFLKKAITENQRNWDSQLKFSRWTNHVTPKRSIRKYPFELVYGKVVVFPIQLVIPIAKLLQEAKQETHALTRRINQLVELHENRE